MEKEAIDELLAPMVGNRFVHKGNTTKVEGYRHTRNGISVSLTNDILVIPMEDITRVLEEFTPFEGGLQTQENNSILQLPKMDISHTVIGSNAASLSSIIMENIKMVQANKDYIPQAEAVNSQIKALIDVAKTEVDMYRTVAFMQKNQ